MTSSHVMMHGATTTFEVSGECVGEEAMDPRPVRRRANTEEACTDSE